MSHKIITSPKLYCLVKDAELLMEVYCPEDELYVQDNSGNTHYFRYIGKNIFTKDYEDDSMILQPPKESIVPINKDELSILNDELIRLHDLYRELVCSNTASACTDKVFAQIEKINNYLINGTIQYQIVKENE